VVVAENDIATNARTANLIRAPSLIDHNACAAAQPLAQAHWKL
jgi:hypothetical protein